MPEISVVIPTYNCAQYIIEAIDSVLKQTYKNSEIIVVDDGSTDDTRAVLQPYISADKIIYIYQENRGPGPARNSGIETAKGRCIAFLDADDIWLPQFLEYSVNKLAENSDAGFVYSGNYFVDENGNEITNYIRRNIFKRGNICLELFCNFFLITSSVVVRKQCFIKTGLFDENLLVGEDNDLFLKLSYLYDAEFIPLKLLVRRVLKGSLSRKNAILDSANDIRTLKKFLSDHPDFYLKNRYRIHQRLSNYHFSYGYYCLGEKKKRIAFLQFIQSIRFSPSVRAFRSLLLCFSPLILRKILRGRYSSRPV